MPFVYNGVGRMLVRHHLGVVFSNVSSSSKIHAVSPYLGANPLAHFVHFKLGDLVARPVITGDGKGCWSYQGLLLGNDYPGAVAWSHPGRRYTERQLSLLSLGL